MRDTGWHDRTFDWTIRGRPVSVREQVFVVTIFLILVLFGSTKGINGRQGVVQDRMAGPHPWLGG